MDDTQHELLRSLGTIGEVQENDRLDAKGTKLEIQKPSLYNSFMRTFVYRQTKDDTISRVKSVVHEAFGEVDRYVKTSKPTRKQLDFLSLLLDEMQGSVRGLQNLQKTYAGVSASQDMKLYAKDMQKKCNMLREYLIRFGVIDDDDSSSGVAPVDRTAERAVERVAQPVERTAERTAERVAVAQPVDRTAERVAQPVEKRTVERVAAAQPAERTVERATQLAERTAERAVEPSDYAVDDITESKTEPATYVAAPMVSPVSSSSCATSAAVKKNVDCGMTASIPGVQCYSSVRGMRPPPLDLSCVANTVVDCSPALYTQARAPSYATYEVYATASTPESLVDCDDLEYDDDISCGATLSSDDSSFF